MKKKVFAILTVFILLLTACSGNKSGNEEVKKLLNNKDKLVVGTSADYPPYEFITNKGGKTEYVGIDMEMARYIAEKWGVELEVQDVKFESLLVGLETGTFDMVIAAMSPSPERKASFSDVYYNSTHGFIIRKGDEGKYKTLKDFEGKTIGVQLGSVQEELAKGIKDIKTKGLPVVTTLLLELKSGKIDAILMEKPVADSYVLSNSDLTVVKDVEVKDDSQGSAVAMREDAKELTQEVNKVIKEIKEKNLVDEWVIDSNKLMNDAEQPNHYGLFVKGIETTLLLSLVSLLIGFVLGMVFILIRMKHIPVISFIIGAFVEIVRGTPMMLQILIVYFGLDVLGAKTSAFTSSIIAVSINSAAYVSEIIRSGIESISKGQMEAGRSLGLSENQTMKKIILPQAFKNILPALGNEFVTLIKETSIASTIGVGELMFQTTKIQSLTFEAMKPLMIVSIIYFVLTFTLTRLMKLMEGKLNYDN
ncbi:ABC transporter substrate-binding protein/permease [Helcococcus kunzii]|uniref:ABC transporter substrate-binding protein/permease n=1 Tax=Helcococcus kunzii TaxID=40091 RepID=UPI0038A2250C